MKLGETKHLAVLQTIAILQVGWLHEEVETATNSTCSLVSVDDGETRRTAIYDSTAIFCSGCSVVNV